MNEKSNFIGKNTRNASSEYAIALIERKSRMPQIQDGKGEAVVRAPQESFPSTRMEIPETRRYSF